MEIEGGEDGGLEGKHFVEDFCGFWEGRRGPGKHFDFCKFVHSIQSLGVDATSASFGAVTAGCGDCFQREEGFVESGVCFHPRERNFGGSGEGICWFCAFGIGRRLGDGVNLLFV